VAFISVLFLLFMNIVFMFPTTRSTSVADMNYTSVLLGGTLILAVGWYYFPVYGGVHWFTGPVRTTEDFQPQNTLGGPGGKDVGANKIFEKNPNGASRTSADEKDNC